MIQRLVTRPPDAYPRPGQVEWADAVDPVGNPPVGAIRSAVDWRRRRTAFAIGVAAFVLGSLLILFQSPWRNDFLSPGPLCQAHAGLFPANEPNRCAGCHESAGQGFASWLQTTFQTSAPGPVQSEKCLACHETQLASPFAREPHQVDPQRLKERTEAIRTSGAEPDVANQWGAWVNLKRSSHERLACRECHREHHGSTDLAAMTDAQCQTCHQRSFPSFAQGHPEFLNGLVRRRSRIAFDHSLHRAKHFPERKAQFDCRRCHVSDPSQSVQLLADFETSCAECHQSQIQAMAGVGIRLLELPMLDLDAIAQFGLDVGDWPDQASGDFDGAIPPLMQVLLAGDPTAAQLIEQAGPEFYFADVDPSDREQVRLASQLAWAIKTLLVDLATEGDQAIRSRLETALGRSVNDRELQGIVRDLDTRLFDWALRQWMPRAAEEIRQRRASLALPRVAWLPNDRDLLMMRTQDEDLLVPNPLSERMQGRGDALPQTTHPSIAQPARTNGPGQVSQPPTPPKIADQDLPKRSMPQPLAANGSAIRLRDRRSQPAGSTDDDRLAINPLQQTVPLANASRPDPPNRSAIPSDSASNLESPSAATQTPRPKTSQPVAPADPIALRPQPAAREAANRAPTFVLPSQHQQGPGWVRDDSRMVIEYQLGGHADPIWVAWADLLASIGPVSTGQPSARQASNSPVRSAQAEFLTARDANACRACHTVDEQRDGTWMVNWNPSKRDPWQRVFNEFSHGPHLLLAELNDCQSCHVLDAQRSNRDHFGSLDGQQVVSNFVPMRRQTCVACHASGSAGRCTTCHSYHIGSRKRLLGKLTRGDE